MSRADELLNNLSGENIDVYAAGSEIEPHIIIRPDRTIEVPESLKRIAVQYDHDIETVTFDAPRYWDGHDLSKLNIYIHYMRPDEKVGRYLTKNVTIDADDPNIMHFEWTISRNVTLLFGNITFIVCAKRVDSDNVERVHWNSELNSEMYVSEGLEPENVAEKNPDIIDSLLTRMDIVEDLVEKSDVLTAVKYYADAKAFVDSAKVEHEQLKTDLTIERSRIDNLLNYRSSKENYNARTTLSPILDDLYGHARGDIVSNGSSAVIILNSLDRSTEKVNDDPEDIGGKLFYLDKDFCPVDRMEFDIDSMAIADEPFTYSFGDDGPVTPNGTVTIDKGCGHTRIAYRKTSLTGDTPLVLSAGFSTSRTIRFHSIKLTSDDGEDVYFGKPVVTMYRAKSEWSLNKMSEPHDIEIIENDSDTALLPIEFVFDADLPVGVTVEIVFDVLDPNGEKDVRLVILDGIVFLSGHGACLVNEPLYFIYPLKYRSDPVPSDEFYDVRVDVNGVEHPTAGEAIRSQHRALYNELDALGKKFEVEDVNIVVTPTSTDFVEGVSMAGIGIYNDGISITTKKGIAVKDGGIIKIKPNGFKVNVLVYSAETCSTEGETILHRSEITQDTDVEVDSKGFVFINVHKKSGSAMTPDEYASEITITNPILNISQLTGNREDVVMSQKTVSNNFTNALREIANGSSIVIDDISPVCHAVNVEFFQKNLIDLTKITENRGLNTSTGGLYYSETSFVTDFIEVNAGSKYHINWKTKRYCVGYGKNKEFVSGLTYSNIFTIPNGVYYVRFVILNGELNTIQFEEGDVATDYTQHIPEITVVSGDEQGNGGENIVVKSGEIAELKSKYPKMRLSNPQGLVMKATYNMDINSLFTSEGEEWED